MPLFSRFLTNISWNVLGKILIQFVMFAVSVALTRYLGKERLGLYASILVVPALARLFNSLGLETVLNKKLPELKVKDPDLTMGRYILRRLFGLRLATSLAFCLLLYFFLPFYSNWVNLPELLDYRWTVVFYFLFVGFHSLLSTLLMTYLEYKTNAVIEVIGAALNLAFLAAFIFMDYGVAGVLWAYILSTAVAAILYALTSRSYWRGEERAADWGDSQKLARASWALGIFSFGLLNQTDVVMMNYFQVSPANVGLYHLAMGVGAMLGFVLTGVGPMALSIFSETYSRESVAGLQKSWRQIVSFTIFFLAPGYVFAFFHSAALIQLIYGADFAPAGPLLSLFVTFLFLQLLVGAGFAVSTLHVLGKSGKALQTTVEGSVLNLALDLALIPVYGETGAVVATGSVLAYMSVRQWYYLQKAMDTRPVFLFAGKVLALCLAAVAPGIIFGSVWRENIFAHFMVFVFVFIAILAWAKPLKREHLDLVSQMPGFVQRALGYFVR